MKRLINISNLLKWFLLISTLILLAFFLRKSYIEKYRPCLNLDSKSEELQLHCWEQVADKLAKNDGLKKGFEMLPVYQANNPKFGESCHEYMHQLGHFGSNYYWDYKKGGQINIPTESEACNYGFYHGLMAAIMTQGVGVAQAKDFCLAVEKSFGSNNPILLDNCYHGIGHGLEYSLVNWDNPQPDINTSIDKCEQLGEGGRSCVRAMFGDLLSRYVSEVLSKKDPDFFKKSINQYEDMYSICKFFPNYRQECVAAFYSYGIDTSKELSILLTASHSVPDKKAIEDVIRTIAKTYSRKSDSSKNLQMIKSCENLKVSNQTFACLTGLLMGKIETVLPQEGSAVGEKLCATPGVLLDAKISCEKALNSLSGSY